VRQSSHSILVKQQDFSGEMGKRTQMKQIQVSLSHPFIISSSSPLCSSNLVFQLCFPRVTDLMFSDYKYFEFTAPENLEEKDSIDYSEIFKDKQKLATNEESDKQCAEYSNLKIYQFNKYSHSLFVSVLAIYNILKLK